MRQVLFAFILFPSVVFAQIGGTSTFEFATIPYSASENAYGGNVITTTERNLPFALKNPSLLDSSYANEAFGNWGMLHLRETGIGLGTIGYAHYLSRGVTMSGGIHFVNYGVFQGYDEEGNKTETFFPSEYALICGASYSVLPNISVGVNVKPILSYMESYSSYGLLFDIGAAYRLPYSCISVVARNVGWQIKPYTQGNREPVPYSIDLGYSQKLEHAPFRVSVTYEDLQKFDLSYTTDNDTEKRKFVLVGKNLLKHVTLSGELLIGKNIEIMVGYNYRKSEDLSFGNSKRGAGLSAGLGLNFSRFQISYGWAKQHAAGGRNFFTLAFNAGTIYSLCKTHFKKPNNDNSN